MNKPLPRDDVAFAAVRRATQEKRTQIFTDPRLLGRPGSPVYNAWDIFGPLIVLMVGSLVILFGFGVLEWIISLLLVLLYQVFFARLVVGWLLHRRTLRKALSSPYELQAVWRTGGIAIALLASPEHNCIAPLGDWRVFAAEYLLEDRSETALVPTE